MPSTVQPHPPTNQPVQPLPAAELQPGFRREFGPLSLAEQEIMDFAQVVDPQPVHIDRDFAASTPFGGIIASGLHAYIKFHKAYWIDMVDRHFICGLSIDGANFTGPVYAEQLIWGRLEILQTWPKPQKGTVAVQWRWQFAPDAEFAQVIQQVMYTSYHTASDRPASVFAAQNAKRDL